MSRMSKNYDSTCYGMLTQSASGTLLCSEIDNMNRTERSLKDILSCRNLMTSARDFACES